MGGPTVGTDAAMKKKRHSLQEAPPLSPKADAAILRLARLLGRQMAREQYEAQLERERQGQEPADSSD